MLRARLIAGVPADLVGSLTGLTEGRFPVAARARYADDLQEAEATKRVKRGQNAANVVATDDNRRRHRDLRPAGRAGGRRPTTARSRRSARTPSSAATWSSRTSTATATPTPTWAQIAKLLPRAQGGRDRPEARARAEGHDAERREGPEARRARIAGRQPAEAAPARPRPHQADAARPSDDDAAPGLGADQAAPVRAPRHAPARVRPAAWTSCWTPRPEGRRLRDLQELLLAPVRRRRQGRPAARLKAGSHVIGGTILGRVGRPDAGKGVAPEVRDPPGGQGRAADRPEADPRRVEAAGGHGDLPRLGPATSSTAATRRTASRSARSCCCPKPQLEKRVLADKRMEIYPGGRDDIKGGPDRPARAGHAGSTWPSPACGRRSPA